MTSDTQAAVTIFLGVVIVILLLAAYGYWTGAWDNGG